MSETKGKIIKLLAEKSLVKQKIFDITLNNFHLLKTVLPEIADYYNNEIKQSNKQVLLEYREKNKFELQLRIAGDLLIFTMHTNIFDFDRSHNIWTTEYVKINSYNTYCGIISIYNFLYDSFRYNRVNDLGYLIGRVFINREEHFFVEGKRQLGFLYNDFDSAVIDRQMLRNIVESAILYTLDFDMFVPPYEKVKSASVAQMKKRMSMTELQTGKRVGFKFYVDDFSNDDEERISPITL